MEIAFISANNLKIELDKKQGKLSGRILSWFKERPSWFIGTMLVGNNIALVVYGVFMAKILEPLFHMAFDNDLLILLFQTIVSSCIILVTAEFLPKSIFRINPNQILGYSSIIQVIIAIILAVPTFLTVTVANALLKLFAKGDQNIKKEEVAFGRVDLDDYVKEIADRAKEKGEIEPEVEILQNALDFSSVKVRECMIPRLDIVSLEVEESIESLKKSFMDTGLSKVLIYRDSIDNIIGYTHSFELFKKPKRIKEMLLPVFIVPETMMANEALELFIKKQQSVAVVVDEFGGTAGILTIEDVVEEIFGEIQDEHDKEDLIEKELKDGSFVFSARIEVDYLNDKYDFQLPISDDYETLGGLIISLYEDLPQEGEVIDNEEYRFEIKKVSDRRIDLIGLSKIQNEE
ncbi:MAG: hemolysin family protein [Flavobacteriales bacterium]|nr:hemolysin family protein [Flavobacteriales bacterium]